MNMKFLAVVTTPPAVYQNLCNYVANMCDFVLNFSGLLEPDFDIGVGKGHDVVGHHQHLFNLPRAEDIIDQSVQKVQTSHDEHVMCEDEVLLM